MPATAPSSGEPALTSLTGWQQLVGLTFGGRYVLRRLVRAGAYGAVFLAHDEALGGRVAVKVLSPLHGSDEFSIRFRREAETLARLQHPNIVGIHGCGRDHDFEYLVMDFVDGRALNEVMKSGAVPWQRAAAICRQVLLALAEAHRHGIVHRDLKPGNVMLVDYPGLPDHVEVVDFGIAKPLDHDADDACEDQVTRQGVLLGTPRYMSPEQCSGAPVDARSDLYSLGVMLFEMLAGRPPFNASTDIGVIGCHLHSAPPPLLVPKGVPDPPEGLTGLVLQLLAKPLDARPDSAEAALEALDVARASEDAPALLELVDPIPSRPTGGALCVAWDTLRLIRRSPLRRFMLAGAGLAAAALVTFPLFVMGRSEPAHEPPAPVVAAQPEPAQPEPVTGPGELDAEVTVSQLPATPKDEAEPAAAPARKKDAPEPVAPPRAVRPRRPASKVKRSQAPPRPTDEPRVRSRGLLLDPSL